MKSKTAVITGATSGIGLAFARYFASQGYDLILTGRRRKELGRTVSELSAEFHVEVQPVFADFANIKDVDRVVKLIRSRRDIEILVNNAGFGNQKPFGEGDVIEQTNMVLVHDLASARFVHAVLPQMMKRNKGIIINVASLAAFMPSPIDPIYCSTKSFLVAFSESLFMKLWNTGIRVQALCPGYTRTDFHGRLGIKSNRMRDRGIVKWMNPAGVVKASIRALPKNNPICVPGFWYKVILGVVRMIPRRLYYRLAARVR